MAAEWNFEHQNGTQNPMFIPLMQEVFSQYYDKAIVPDLEAMQVGCASLQSLYPAVNGWEKQAQQLFGANNNPFDAAFGEITTKTNSAMLNCWNQTISPCVDWTNQTQAAT